MTSPILRVLLGLGIVLVVAGLIVEVRGWISGARSVNRRQKTLRLSSGALMIAILAMILLGDQSIRAYHPLAAVAYWTLCFTFAAGLVVLALLDLKKVALKYGEQKKRNLEELAKRARSGTDAE